MKKVIAKKDYCVACGLCEIYCATVHSQYPDSVLKAYKLNENQPISSLYVEKKGAVSYGIQCRHCEDAPCVSACISGAMYKDKESGLVLVDEERCISCYTCIAACPYGLIKKYTSKQKGIIKCDMCYEKASIPVCVSNCPNGALVYEEEEVI